STRSSEKGNGAPAKKRQASARSSSAKPGRYAARIADFSSFLVVAAICSATTHQSMKRGMHAIIRPWVSERQTSPAKRVRYTSRLINLAGATDGTFDRN